MAELFVDTLNIDLCLLHHSIKKYNFLIASRWFGLDFDQAFPVNFSDPAKPVMLAYGPHGVFCTAFSGSHGVLHPGLAEHSKIPLQRYTLHT
jgi:hypothetical protein